ncbi:NADP-dependent oxidoreductase [Deinococcus psychrotolerans]|uniref:NADP-dependent oxidoreductase n=1 Tax=Deinococcus psychrotolerans TaxID=2489213 RepID=A0A3G8YSV5_9DEIO|nr:NADP-dependent oxidoreductase [Deinococcus psychrotolerans]AZI44326.1 NADP-dependent oxidoreductase [Deinococcus psychrotolerans]
MTAQRTLSREVQLAARPQGAPKDSDFSMVERELGQPGAGEVLVRNLYLSVDPYMRGRMNDVKSYTPPFALNQTMTGGAVGEVIASGADGLSVGDLVLHDQGWRTHALLPAQAARKVEVHSGLSPRMYLGILGMPGLTAYAGLLEVASFKPGDVVFVSGAAGAVGSAVGQIARLKGAREVIGSAGSAAKVAHLTNVLGFDAAFNYKDSSVAKQLRQTAPDGIDVYFDNVGGDHLEAALFAFNPFGRAALCGAISQYNAAQPPSGPRNLALAIGKQLTLRGFIVSSYSHLFPQFTKDVSGWLLSGELHHDETVVEGIENTPEAFMGMLDGQNTGKMVIKL